VPQVLKQLPCTVTGICSGRTGTGIPAVSEGLIIQLTPPNFTAFT